MATASVFEICIIFWPDVFFVLSHKVASLATLTIRVYLVAIRRPAEHHNEKDKHRNRQGSDVQQATFPCRDRLLQNWDRQFASPPFIAPCREIPKRATVSASDWI